MVRREEEARKLGEGAQESGRGTMDVSGLDSWPRAGGASGALGMVSGC